MLELQPGTGVGNLKFGDSTPTAKEMFGDGFTRNHVRSQLSTSLHYPEIGLVLYFTTDDRLVNIVADGDTGTFSLLGQPLAEIFGAIPPYSDRIREWIQERGLTLRTPRSHMGCWDYEIDGMNFSFAIPEEGAPAVSLRSGT